jgi:hypothetical protein
MNQLSFLDTDAPQAPIARTSDPATSHEAGEAITANGKRDEFTAEALRLVRSAGPEGICGSEMDEHLRKRLTELEEAGLVRRGEPRVSKVTKFRNTTWWPA